MKDVPKKRTKKVNKLKKLALCLSAAIIIGNIATTKATAYTRIYTQLNQIAEQCFKGYNNGTRGPISINKGVLTKNGRRSDIYLICLSGTEFVKNQSTGLMTDLKAGFEQNSPFLLRLASVINSTIPKGANLVFAGHSLGGMIAQQASGHASIRNNYNILNVVTFGSPLINPFGREGEIRRVGDTSDVVPYLSAMGTMLFLWQVGGLNREDGHYNGNSYNAHIKSYLRSDIWGAYDVLGRKWGGANIKFDPDQSKFYTAPTR